MKNNKKHQEFNLYKPHIYELRHLDPYEENEVVYRGNTKQIINYILNQQL